MGKIFLVYFKTQFWHIFYMKIWRTWLLSFTGAINKTRISPISGRKTKTIIRTSTSNIVLLDPHTLPFVGILTFSTRITSIWALPSKSTSAAFHRTFWKGPAIFWSTRPSHSHYFHTSCTYVRPNSSNSSKTKQKQIWSQNSDRTVGWLSGSLTTLVHFLYSKLKFRSPIARSRDTFNLDLFFDFFPFQSVMKNVLGNE